MISGRIRSMAIRHFGELLREMSQYIWMLNDVVLRGLVPLILFLEDDEQRVANKEIKSEGEVKKKKEGRKTFGGRMAFINLIFWLTEEFKDSKIVKKFKDSEWIF
ncbi:hypothetical protein P7K49_037795 [Saguinus oedipus]|uniref:Uncharacterized protein n=1 Tax=Saguinus oedipus TaxID=9490 RepID=A0ABQ9TJ58_SAGOE|nr:hypothetical protein P7K49_037795 [Saguinus oedipus]